MVTVQVQKLSANLSAVYIQYRMSTRMKNRKRNQTAGRLFMRHPCPGEAAGNRLKTTNVGACAIRVQIFSEQFRVRNTHLMDGK